MNFQNLKQHITMELKLYRDSPRQVLPNSDVQWIEEKANTQHKNIWYLISWLI